MFTFFCLSSVQILDKRTIQREKILNLNLSWLREQHFFLQFCRGKVALPNIFQNSQRFRNSIIFLSPNLLLSTFLEFNSFSYIPETYFLTLKEPRNRFRQPILPGGPVPTRSLAPIDCYKIPTLTSLPCALLSSRNFSNPLRRLLSHTIAFLRFMCVPFFFQFASIYLSETWNIPPKF